MNRSDYRNQVGSRSTRWSSGKLSLDVRHSYDSGRTQVWVADVTEFVRYHGPKGLGFSEMRHIATARRTSREQAIRDGMRLFRKALAVGGPR